MHRSGTRRSHRLADQVMREVAEILATESADPRLARLTVSGVRLNSDLSMAEVLYTIGPHDEWGGDEELKSVQEALDRAAGFVRGRLGKRLRSKFVPDLRFTFDNYLEDTIYERGPDDDSSHSA